MHRTVLCRSHNRVLPVVLVIVQGGVLQSDILHQLIRVYYFLHSRHGWICSDLPHTLSVAMVVDIRKEPSQSVVSNGMTVLLVLPLQGG